MQKLVFLSLLSCLLFVGCSTAREGSTAKLRNDTGVKDVNATEIDVNTGIDLATYLRRLPGISIRGDGPNAQVQVRGNSGFGGGSAPLFVVNGTNIGTSFSTLISMVDPSEIASVRVLKNASDTAEYGLQGGNGVLEFKLKK